MRLVHDIQEDDNNLGLYSKVANQGLPVNWQLQLDRVGIFSP